MSKTCETLKPANNFETLGNCANLAEVEVQYVGGRRKQYCMECAKPQMDLMRFFNPSKGRVKFARSI